MMELSRRIKSNLWYRYFFYYFIIFLVPFSILAIFTYQLSIDGAKQQFEGNVKNELISIERQFTSQLRSLNEIALSITVNNSISPFFMTHPFHSRIGIQMLSNYIVSQENVDTVILYYFSDKGQYFSSRGSMRLDVMHDMHFRNTGISPDSLERLFYLKEPQIIFLSESNTENNQLQYLVPLLDSQGIQYGSVMFLLNRNNLMRILPPVTSDHLNNIKVMDGSGTILLSNVNDVESKFLNNQRNLLESVLDENSNSKLGNDHLISNIFSEQFDLHFVSIVSKQELTASILEVRSFIIFFLVSLLLLGVALVGIASYLHYLPIKKVHFLLESKKQSNINAGNELDKIQFHVTSILNQNEILALENKSLQAITESQALLELIEDNEGGEIINHDHPFIQDLKVTGSNYYIALIKKNQLSEDARSHIQKTLPLINKQYKAYMVQIPLQNKIAIVVVHSEPGLSLHTSLQGIDNELRMLNESFKVHCGKMYDNLNKIKHSYIEAMIACDYIVQDPEDNIICYRGEASENKDFLEYPLDVETKLVHSINQGANDVAIDSMRQIFQFIYENRRYTEELKVYNFYLINLMMKTAATIGAPREKIQLDNLMGYRSMEELEEEMLRLLEIFIQFVQSKKAVVRDMFREEIFVYISENFISPDLSLEFLAEKYDYSTPYLSKIIKEETGMTFTKYVQELRLNSIKKQLVETNLPIKDIINQNGYYDVSNFSRKFKNILGITPGQYRALQREVKE